MLVDRILALVIATPFLALLVAALRFYLHNPGVRERTPRDYVREQMHEQMHEQAASHRSTPRKARRNKSA